MADIKLSADPTSTWGATDEYKAAWNEKYGTVAPNASASKSEWVDFATKAGMPEADAEAMTRDDLAEQFAPGQVYSAPSVPNTSTAAGSGEAPGSMTPTPGSSARPSS